MEMCAAKHGSQKRISESDVSARKQPRQITATEPI